MLASFREVCVILCPHTGKITIEFIGNLYWWRALAFRLLNVYVYSSSFNCKIMVQHIFISVAVLLGMLSRAAMNWSHSLPSWASLSCPLSNKGTKPQTQSTQLSSSPSQKNPNKKFIIASGFDWLMCSFVKCTGDSLNFQLIISSAQPSMLKNTGFTFCKKSSFFLRRNHNYTFLLCKRFCNHSIPGVTLIEYI